MREIEFHYRGMPVGQFKDDPAPIAKGIYGYKAYRGPGDADMRQAVETEGKARCYYDTGEGRLFFSVRPPVEAGILNLDDFEIVRLADKGPIDWLEPWVPAVAGAERELKKEAGTGHVLYQVECVPVARRIDSDDVLFRIPGRPDRFALVRLTWSGKPGSDATLPATELFDSLEEWAERRMAKDHEAFLES
ncbi:MAG: hypothetical protein JWP91_2703 [Fibrobacteres bacterium]|nr:hypothetical protein [Fibrobacterota bacterium]